MQRCVCHSGSIRPYSLRRHEFGVRRIPRLFFSFTCYRIVFRLLPYRYDVYAGTFFYLSVTQGNISLRDRMLSKSAHQKFTRATSCIFETKGRTGSSGPSPRITLFSMVSQVFFVETAITSNAASPACLETLVHATDRTSATCTSTKMTWRTQTCASEL
jgi:hypothetical protein